ncbi:MAG: methylated-DNA--[Acidaminococcaceae bacterium]|nr:methylated-DNA--[protein]-cysteine S-methyltransferase [Acidaminococcaceae bacterium]
MDYVHHYKSFLGNITMASDGEALTGLWFDGQKYFAETLGKEQEEKELPVFAQTERWLDIYFSGKQPDFTPPLSMKTTQFRKAVWDILLTIPYGRTMTYGQIAKIIAKEKGIAGMSAQAVGGAVGHNPISLIIPCHRVVGTSGSLTGYAGGIRKKVRLLELEKADMSGLLNTQIQLFNETCRFADFFDLFVFTKTKMLKL